MSDLEQRYVSKYCEASEDYYPFDTHDDQFLLLSETVQALNEKDKRIAELENSNTHAGLRTMYQKAQARIAELEKHVKLSDWLAAYKSLPRRKKPSTYIQGAGDMLQNAISYAALHEVKKQKGVSDDFMATV